MPSPNRPSTSQRGLGHVHQQRRKQLLPLAYGTRCALCGAMMQRGDDLDLDHSMPRSRGGTVGDRIVHSSCNRSRGDGTRSKQRAHRSREW